MEPDDESPQRARRSWGRRDELNARPRSERMVGHALLRLGSATQAALVTATGLSRPTVSDALGGLRGARLVEVTDGEIAPGPAGSGRRPRVYRLGRRAGVVVGVDIGRGHVTAMIVDGAHRRLRHLSHLALDRPVEDGPGPVLKRTAELVRRICADVPGPVLGVGVGMPMPLTAGGQVGSRTLLPAWADTDPQEELSAALDGLGVYLANDASLGALGEFTFGIGEGSRDLTYVKLGTGIGGGSVVNGRLHVGAGGTAGEIGHVTVDHQGLRCPCGNRGCLERYAGGPALLASARQSGLALDDLAGLVDRACSGDVACRRIITEAAIPIGAAIGSLINLTGPELIVLGGGLSRAEEILLAPLRIALEHAALPPAVEAVSIRVTSLGPTASVLGAIALAIERYTDAGQ